MIDPAEVKAYLSVEEEQPEETADAKLNRLRSDLTESKSALVTLGALDSVHSELAAYREDAPDLPESSIQRAIRRERSKVALLELQIKRLEATK